MADNYTLGTSITVFIVITLVYFLIRISTATYDSNAEAGSASYHPPALEGLYFLLILILQYIWNFSNASYICGVSQSYLNVAFYTLVPNFFIFATIYVIIRVYPGWLSPFSNTIGYALVSCMGLKQTFNDLLVEPNSNKKLIKQICGNMSLVINEIDPRRFAAFVQKMSKDYGVLKQEKAARPAYQRLFKLVTIKQTIAEAIWYLFAGCLILSISFSAVSNMSCTFTTSQMRDIHTKMKEESAQSNTAKLDEQPQYYARTA